MIKHVRQFFARIVDTRVSEAVIDLHRSMQHLEINNDERHKVILNCLDKLNSKVQLSGDNAHNAVLSVKDGLVNNRDLIIAAVKDNYPTTAKPPVPPAPGTKKPFVGAELKSKEIKNSKRWAGLNDTLRALFVSQVKGIFEDETMQQVFEERYFTVFYPAVVMLDNAKGQAISDVNEEFL